jgi:hypothetical protein
MPLLGTESFSSWRSIQSDPEVRVQGRMEVGSGRSGGRREERCAEANMVHDVTIRFEVFEVVIMWFCHFNPEDVAIMFLRNYTLSQSRINVLSYLPCINANVFVVGRWDRGFESHLRHVCLVCVCVHSVSVLPCVYVAALRQADHSSKGFYCLWKIITELNKRSGP